MTGQSIIPIVIDTDNALRTPRTTLEKIFGGDVDDAFAIAFLLCESKLVSAIYSVSGNADSKSCYENNCEILAELDSKVPCYEGLGRKHLLRAPTPQNGSEYLALGPLTNLAYFCKNQFMPSQIWMTLGRIQTRGRWPPFWPVEFNATQDLDSFQIVISQKIKKTIVPLDIAFQLQLLPTHKTKICESQIGRYLWRNSRRWSWRSLLVKGRRSFPVWDLVSAIASRYPETCHIEKGYGYLFSNGLFLCDVNDIPKTYHDRKKAIQRVEINIVTNIDTEKMWSIFFQTINELPTKDLF